EARSSAAHNGAILKIPHAGRAGRRRHCHAQDANRKPASGPGRRHSESRRGFFGQILPGPSRRSPYRPAHTHGTPTTRVKTSSRRTRAWGRFFASPTRKFITGTETG